MKTFIAFIVILLVSFSVQAGTLTINTTAPQDARIVAAFGKQLGTMDLTDPEKPVPRNATGAEVKASLIQYIKQVVFDQERKTAVDAVSVPSIDPN